MLADGGKSSLAKIGAEMGLPRATAYRLAAALSRAGYLIPLGRGRLVAGPTLAALAHRISLRPALLGLARPIVDALAQATGGIAHLGILEQDMVTYLLKAGHGPGVFTAEGKQLEAYCSGIGKLLLAHLPTEELANYLDNGPFIALTPRTITDPVMLERAFAEIRRVGFARDEEEAGADVHCLAVPIRDDQGGVIAAVSITRNHPDSDEDATLRALRDAASQLQSRIFCMRGEALSGSPLSVKI